MPLFNFPVPKASSLDADTLVARWVPKIIVFGLLLILLTTLYPFRFIFSGDMIAKLRSDFSITSSLSDVLQNIVLYMPLGFGLYGWLRRRRRGAIAKFGIVLLISLALSSFIEYLQLFLPSRFSSLVDVTTNTSGGVLGAMVFYGWGIPILGLLSALFDSGSALIARLSIQGLVAILVLYGVLAFGVAIAQQATTLKGWNPSYSLQMGGAWEEDAPWKGTIAQMQIADRAVSDQEADQILAGQMPSGFDRSLISDYTFDRSAVRGAGSRDRLGNTSDLIWQGGASGRNDTSVSLDAEHWLKSSHPETAMIQRIRQTSQFTLSITLTPTGPPTDQLTHILSIADRSTGYNLALGQYETHLAVWLQTLIKPSQKYIPKYIPDGFLVATFTENKPKRIVLSYAGSVLRLYASQPQQKSPQQAFVVDLVEPNTKVLTLGLTFAPLGFLLSVIGERLRKRLPLYVAVLLGGAVLLPLLREGLMAAVAVRSVSRSNSLLALFVMATILLLSSGRSLRLGRRQN